MNWIMFFYIIDKEHETYVLLLVMQLKYLNTSPIFLTESACSNFKFACGKR